MFFQVYCFLVLFYIVLEIFHHVTSLRRDARCFVAFSTKPAHAAIFETQQSWPDMSVRVLLLSKVVIRLVNQDTSMLFSAVHIDIGAADAPIIR